jgi:membrane protein
MATTTWQRGRQAESPGDIPAKGWKDTLLRVKTEIKDDRLSMIAAAMAYYALFAFVPAISAIVLIYAWISDPAEISNHLTKVSRFVPAETLEVVKNQLTALSSKTSVGVGAIGAILFALWSASKGSKAIMEAMNVIYDEREERSFLKFNLMAIGMTLLGAVLGVVAISVVIGVPAVTNLFNFGKAFELLVTLGSWVVLLGLFSFFLSFAYRFGPSRKQAKWKWVSRGAIIASVLWALASILFSWYAKEFADFNKTYGSLGAMIALMTWFYLSSFVILLGGEVNAELEHQTMKDTTTGIEKPMGARGAQMADTVGPALGDKKKK